MDQIAAAIAIALVTGAVSALVTVAAIRVELRWHRRDLDKLEKRVDRLDKMSRSFQPAIPSE